MEAGNEWIECRIGYWRGYLYGEFTAVYRGEAPWSIAGLSDRFRWRGGGVEPPRTPATEARLAELCRTLEDAGWERHESGVPGSWYELSFRRVVGPQDLRDEPQPQDELELQDALITRLPVDQTVQPALEPPPRTKSSRSPPKRRPRSVITEDSRAEAPPDVITENPAASQAPGESHDGDAPSPAEPAEPDEDVITGPLVPKKRRRPPATTRPRQRSATRRKPEQVALTDDPPSDEGNPAGAEPETAQVETETQLVEPVAAPEPQVADTPPVVAEAEQAEHVESELVDPEPETVPAVPAVVEQEEQDNDEPWWYDKSKHTRIVVALDQESELKGRIDTYGFRRRS